MYVEAFRHAGIGPWSRRWGRWLCVLLLSLGVGGVLRAEPAFELAVFPYLSTRALFGLYAPLREALQDALGRPVVLVTAADFRSFFESARHGEYPLIGIAPHGARLMQREAGYVPLASARRELHPCLVVAADSPLQRLSDLRGTRLATPDRLAIVNSLARRALHDAGLDVARELTFHEYPSHSAVLAAVLQGDVQVGVLSSTVWLRTSPAEREGLRLLAELHIEPPIPPMMFLARGDLPPTLQAQLRQVLLGFADTPAGAEFMRRSGHIGYREPSTEELRSLDDAAEELARALDAAP